MASCFAALCQDAAWSYLRSTGFDRQSGGRFHILRGIVVPVVDRSAGGTGPLPDVQGRGYESVATLISRVREARRDGEVVRMAELAREMASVLGPSMQGEAHGLTGVEEVLAEASGQFLTDPSWPDRLITATDLLCNRSAGSGTASSPNPAAGGAVREVSR